ncbi:hypothetical protein Tco_0458542 [Tanacetum coccineum]
MPFLESCSHLCLEIIPLHSQMVKFVFRLLDLSSRTVLLYQKLLEFNPGASLSSVFLLVLSVFAIVVAYASRAAISNPEVSQSNLAIISHLLSLKFSNLSMRLLEFSFQIRVHLDDSKFPQSAPCNVPDLSYESFLLSQMLEVGLNIGDSIEDGGTIVGSGIGTSLDPSWSGLRLHLSCDEFLRKLGMQGVGVIRVRMDMGDKEVTKQDLVAKVVMEVLGRLLGDMVVMSWRCLRS